MTDQIVKTNNCKFIGEESYPIGYTDGQPFLSQDNLLLIIEETGSLKKSQSTSKRGEDNDL